MISRRNFLHIVAGTTMVGTAVAGTRTAAADVAEIGFLYPGTRDAAERRMPALAAGMREYGFVDGRDVTLLPRTAEFAADQLQPLAAELARRKVRVILAAARGAVKAVQAATTEIPVVAVDLESDPVAEGFAASLARPGGNITGVFFDFPEFAGKWLEMLNETVPDLKHVAAFWDRATGAVQREAILSIGTARGVAVDILELSGPDEFGAAFETARRKGAQAVLTLSSPIVGGNVKQLAAIAAERGMPVVSLFPDYVEAGGLMAYGPNVQDLFHQCGTVIGKVLSGRRPADLPIERPERIRMLINLKAARALGLSFSSTLLARADEVIE